MSFNSQPPEGGWMYVNVVVKVDGVSTHSRPKAAGDDYSYEDLLIPVSTHSRPKAAGAFNH